MIHIHARRPDGTPSHAVEDFRAITEAIRAEVGDDVIVNYSTGAVGVSVEERVAYLRALRPEVAALNMGSMNYAKYSPRRREFVFQAVFANPFDEIIALLEAMNDARDQARARVLRHRPRRVARAARRHGPAVARRCTPRSSWAWSAACPRPRATSPRWPTTCPAGSHWGVIGISRAQWMLVAAALTLGGSVRVGLEDNLYLPDGTMARSNGDLVAKARAADARRRAAPGDRRRGARAARHPGAAAREAVEA